MVGRYHMKKSKANDSNLKMIFISICIVCLLIIGGLMVYSFHLYGQIEASQTNELNKTKENILKNETLTNVTEMYEFNDDSSFHIMVGKNQEGKNQYVFVPIDENDGKLMTIYSDEIISKEQAINYGTSDCVHCRVVKASPAMINHQFLWEVIYYDEKTRYVIDYISMKDGERIEQLRLASKYRK